MAHSTCPPLASFPYHEIFSDITCYLLPSEYHLQSSSPSTTPPSHLIHSVTLSVTNPKSKHRYPLHTLLIILLPEFTHLVVGLEDGQSLALIKQAPGSFHTLRDQNAPVAHFWQHIVDVHLDMEFS